MNVYDILSYLMLSYESSQGTFLTKIVTEDKIIYVCLKVTGGFATSLQHRGHIVWAEDIDFGSVETYLKTNQTWFQFHICQMCEYNENCFQTALKYCLQRKNLLIAESADTQFFLHCIFVFKSNQVSAASITPALSFLLICIIDG